MSADRTPTAPLPVPAAEALDRLTDALTPSPSEVAARHEAASEHYRSLASHADHMPAADFDELLCLQDEVTMCRCQLQQAGRLDLIGGSR